MQRRTALILALLLPIQIIFLQILKNFPEFVEKYYSLGFYPILSKVSRYLFGWVPFSVGDVFYILITLLALRWIYKNFKRLRYDPQWFFIDIAASVSIVYFMFHVLWGFNYYRLPLHQSLKLQSDYTYEELLLTTMRFIEKSNEMHRKLAHGDTLRIDLPYSQKEMFKKSVNGYKNLEKEYPQLAYWPRSIKKSGWSLGLTYMGYSGYLNPFSGEAQVNNLVKTYKFPVVACHEEAHQIGFAAENEANFIATLATLHNEDPYIQYAGYIFTLRYLINEVARNDMDQFLEFEKIINPGIMASYKEMRDFWTKYDNPFDKFTSAFWDNFLKANNQTHGIKSYNYMVALVVNYYEKRPL
ncbi:DUF3810 domain-containing protein [Aequorivita sp. H23M31]|uniref:DUF3810 domain-containing protein n=1 Tax=Aequorivita ciconiae TaxID=2494375 RepID=A0A410G7A7_9FLAO|nr:DUF3810 domain-containing protein [Aequorivita sp. H23M31]QAA83120.1 DUF3810 domain-containing protein [Aequorivita sp. H23M31]